jgi:serine/threonine-protein kinase RsbT
VGLSRKTIKLNYEILSDDFSTAGEASSNMKKMLIQLGIKPDIIKRASISMYEAEINAVIHADGGEAEVEIDSDKIVIRITDTGPGIPDIDLAMKEGYSTAPDSVRQLGFGAGMGLPNIKRYADKLDISTEIGQGTKVEIIVNYDGKVLS